jgi:hypothetical protein
MRITTTNWNLLSSLRRKRNYGTSSVPKKDVCPISQIISCPVEVAAVVKTSCPVHCLAMEVLLMIGWLLLTW